MRQDRKAELQRKGWTDKEVEHAEKVLERAERHDIFFSKLIFWSAVLVAVIGNLLVSLILIPFLIVLNSVVLYGAVAILAAVIGFVYNFLITDIGHLEKKHHLWAGILVPLLALVNILIVVGVANALIDDLRVENAPHNIWLVALVFVLAFILPYSVDRVLYQRIHGKEEHTAEMM